MLIQAGDKYVRVEQDGKDTVLTILGPQGSVQARAWLPEHHAARLAAAIKKSSQGR